MKRLAVSLLLCCPVVAEPFKIHRIGRPETANRWEVSTVAYDTKWLGTLSTDWDEAGNWSNGVPDAVTNVEVLIDGSAERDLILNLDRTGDTAGAGLHLTTFHIHETTTIQVGGPGNPLKLTATDFKNRSPKAVYFTSESGTGGGSTNRLVQYGTGYFEYASVGSSGVSGRFSLMEILTGTGRISLGSVNATNNLMIAGREPGAIVTLTGSTDITYLDIYGGVLNLETTNGTSETTVLTLNNGTVNYLTGGITNVKQYSGTFVHNQITGGFQITSYYGYGGVLDLLQTYGEKGIATLYQDSFDGSFELLDDDRLITVSTKNAVIGQ